MEAQEQRYPAQVGDKRFLVLQNAVEDVVLIGRRDRSPESGRWHRGQKAPHHNEASDVLVVGVQSRLGGVVLGHKGIGRQRVHVLRHQGGDHTPG